VAGKLHAGWQEGQLEYHIAIIKTSHSPIRHATFVNINRESCRERKLTGLAATHIHPFQREIGDEQKGRSLHHHQANLKHKKPILSYLVFIRLEVVNRRNTQCQDGLYLWGQDFD
jgi:hypothetical protein